MLDLNNKEQMQDFCNNIAAAKLIAEELGDSYSYEDVVNIADELNVSVAEVQGYLKLYQYVSKEMML